jgi:shikimate dehydrogenase
MGCTKEEIIRVSVMQRLFGLIGFPLSHSWSKKFFEKKFKDEAIADASYELFPLENICKLTELIQNNPDLKGLNVTIPYKQQVIRFINHLDEVAEAVNAVNTILVRNTHGTTELLGYNTDVYGFQHSLQPLLKPHHRKALILGTGGAAQAAAFVFTRLGIEFSFVSRSPGIQKSLTYNQLDADLMEAHQLIVNATPTGMFPAVHACPPIPYQLLNSGHLLFDMVYNPETTLFMKHGISAGAEVKSGLEMLHLQALRSWKIWNSV